MTDEELAQRVAEIVRLDPNSREGVLAMLGFAANLEEQEPEFAPEPRGIATGGALGGSLAAQRMLQLARRTGDPRAAVAWLRKVGSARRAVGGAVKALYGVQCSERVSMSDDVELRPFMELPQSGMRDWLWEEHRRAREAPGLHRFPDTPPYAALYRPGILEPLFDPPSDAETSESLVSSWFDDLDTAAMLLALAGRSVPLEAAHWFHCDDPDVALLCQQGIHRAYSSSYFGISSTGVVTASAAAGLLTAFKSLRSEDDQDRIALALRRLIRSRQHSGDSAIDLAIALEVLFMNQERDEHSYKISLRAAKFLRQDVPGRRLAVAYLKKLYDLRSVVVHTGKARNDWSIDGTKVSTYEVVRTSDSLCAEAISKFIQGGSIPKDWRDIELS